MTCYIKVALRSLIMFVLVKSTISRLKKLQIPITLVLEVQFLQKIILKYDVLESSKQARSILTMKSWEKKLKIKQT